MIKQTENLEIAGRVLAEIIAELFEAISSLSHDDRGLGHSLIKLACGTVGNWTEVSAPTWHDAGSIHNHPIVHDSTSD